jgi:hypothetical protein
MVFCFEQHKEFEYFSFCHAKREFFFQNSTLVYMTNILNQIFFQPELNPQNFPKHPQVKLRGAPEMGDCQVIIQKA